VCARRVDLLVCSLPLHRHSYIGFILAFASSFHNKQRFRRSPLSSLGQLTHTRRTDGSPEPDGALRTVVRTKIRHYRQLYINQPRTNSFHTSCSRHVRQYFDHYNIPTEVVFFWTKDCRFPSLLQAQELRLRSKLGNRQSFVEKNTIHRYIVAINLRGF
jgi:hypothetical protein